METWVFDSWDLYDPTVWYWRKVGTHLILPGDKDGPHLSGDENPMVGCRPATPMSSGSIPPAES